MSDTVDVLSPADEESALRADLSTYIGPKAQEYLMLWDDQRYAGKSRGSFFWPAFLVPTAWLLYRKQYGLAGAVIAVSLLAGLLLPNLSSSLSSSVGIAVSVMMATYGRSLYVRSAERAVKRIAARYPDHDQRDAALRRSGGTSVLGAVICTVIIIAALASIVLAPLLTKLPACDSREARQTALHLFEGLAAKLGHADAEWTIENIAEVNAIDSGRSCSATFVAGTPKFAATYDITWIDKKAGRFQVSLKVLGAK